jgi:hypothetical protein
MTSSASWPPSSGPPSQEPSTRQCLACQGSPIGANRRCTVEVSGPTMGGLGQRGSRGLCRVTDPPQSPLRAVRKSLARQRFRQRRGDITRYLAVS